MVYIVGDVQWWITLRWRVRFAEENARAGCAVNEVRIN